MAHPVAELRALSDEDLITLHDQHAIHTMVGVDYYLDELKRRDQERSSSRAIVWPLPRSCSAA